MEDLSKLVHTSVKQRLSRRRQSNAKVTQYHERGELTNLSFYPPMYDVRSFLGNRCEEGSDGVWMVVLFHTTEHWVGFTEATDELIQMLPKGTLMRKMRAKVEGGNNPCAHVPVGVIEEKLGISIKDTYRRPGSYAYRVGTYAGCRVMWFSIPEEYVGAEVEDIRAIG